MLRYINHTHCCTAPFYGHYGAQTDFQTPHWEQVEILGCISLFLHLHCCRASLEQSLHMKEHALVGIVHISPEERQRQLSHDTAQQYFQPQHLAAVCHLSPEKHFGCKPHALLPACGCIPFAVTVPSAAPCAFIVTLPCPFHPITQSPNNPSGHTAGQVMQKGLTNSYAKEQRYKGRGWTPEVFGTKPICLLQNKAISKGYKGEFLCLGHCQHHQRGDFQYPNKMLCAAVGTNQHFQQSPSSAQSSTLRLASPPSK